MGVLRPSGWFPKLVQAMPRAIRFTPWRAPASVFSPRVRWARSFVQAVASGLAPDPPAALPPWLEVDETRLRPSGTNVAWKPGSGD